jgi:hypothetical protein
MLWRKSHEAVFSDSYVLFTFIMDVGEHLNIERAARKLLEADIAYSAAWPSETSVRVPSSQRPLHRQLGRFQKMIEDAEEAHAKNGWLRFALKHPITVLQGLPKGKKKPSKSHESDGGFLTRANAVLDEAHMNAVRSVGVSAVERRIDAGLFSPQSRERDAFVRLVLRNSYHWLEVADEEALYFVAEPRLMLHRSGTVQLTVSVTMPKEMRTRDLVRMSHAGQLMVTKSQWSEPLLADLPARNLGGTWTDDLDSGARLREIEYDGATEWSEIMMRYLDGCFSAIGRNGQTGWLSYPTVMTKAGACCSTRGWRRRHADDITRLAIRSPSRAALAPSVTAGEDLSDHRDSSLFANMGSATHISFGGEVPTGVQQLYTSLITEYAVLLYWRLRQTDRALAKASVKGRAVARLNRTSLALLAEARLEDLSHGTTRRIVRTALHELGGEQVRESLITSLDLSSQAIALRSAARQAQGGAWLAYLAVVLSVLVAIPTLSGPLAAWHASIGELSPAWLRQVGRHATELPLMLLAGLLAVGAVVAVVSFIAFLARTIELPKRWRRRGYFWKRLEIHAEPNEAEDEA